MIKTILELSKVVGMDDSIEQTVISRYLKR